MSELILIIKAMARNWLANYLNKKAEKLAKKLEKIQSKWENLQ